MTHPSGPPEGTTWHDLKDWSIGSLTSANLVPLFGTLFLGWTRGIVLILYWVETAVIGFYSILKMPIACRWFSLFSVPSFIVHFGVFFAVGGGLAIGAHSMVDGVPLQGWGIVYSIHGEVGTFWFLMLESHGISCVRKFIGEEEYQPLKKEPDQPVVAPYRRIFVMMTRRGRGGCPRGSNRGSHVLMSLFIVLKIVTDVIAHLNEHDMIQRGGKA